MRHPAPLLLVLALALLSACAPRMQLVEPRLPLPDRYPDSEPEQANAGDLSWRDFFADPHLLELIETAVENNREAQVLLARMNAAKSEILARRGELLPAVELETGLERERRTENGAEEALVEFLENYRFGARATWEVDVWGKLRKRARAATLEYLASVDGYNFLVTNLVAEVAHDYYELLALDNRLLALQRNIELLRQALGIAREMKRFARANQLAINRYEAELYKNEAELYETRQRMVEVENHLQVLLGRFSGPIHREPEAFLHLEPPVMKAGLPAQLLDRRPDIRRAELEMEAARIDVRAVKADFYPRLDLEAFYRLESKHPQYLFTPEGVARGLAADVVAPLLNRSEVIARYKSAGARQVQAVHEYEQAVIRAYAEVATHLAHLRFMAQEFRLKEKQAATLSQSIDLAEQLFQSARAEYLEVLLVQREALEAKIELIEIKEKQMAAMVSLYRALGGGWK